MFEDYLYQLVQSLNRVIVPDLGAFLRKDKTDTSEGTLIFSPFLRFNDGLVEEFLVGKKNKTKDEAAKIVQDFVKKVKDTATQGVVVVKKLGAFYLDGRGVIQFFFSSDTKNIAEKIAASTGGTTASTTTDDAAAIPAKAANDGASISAVAASTPKTKKPRVNKKSAEKEEREDKENKEDVPVTPQESVEEEKSSPANDKGEASKIDAAAKQLEKWQETAEQKKSDMRIGVDIEPVQTEEKPVATTSLPVESEKNEDEISQRAKEIMEEKMGSFRKQQEQRSRAAESADTKKSSPTSFSETDDRILDDYDESYPSYTPHPRRRTSRKTSRWIFVLLIIAGGVIAAYWLWDDILPFVQSGKDQVAHALSSKSTDDADSVATEDITNAKAKTKTEKPTKTPAPAATESTTPQQPVIGKKEKGMFYTGVQKLFDKQDAVEYCETLHKLGYTKAEILHTSANVYVICIDKGASKETLVVNQQNNPYKYGEVWIVE